jgi:hypothetical protein
MPTHLYITLEDEILTVDNAAERVEARRQMREAGVAELMIWQGGPDEPCESTGQLLTSNPAHAPEDYAPPADGAGAEKSLEDFDYPNRGSYTLANWLRILLDAESDDAEREEALEMLASCGRAQAQTFDDAGLITHDDGVVLTFGDGASYQITVKRAR